MNFSVPVRTPVSPLVDGQRYHHVDCTLGGSYSVYEEQIYILIHNFRKRYLLNLNSNTLIINHITQYMS